MCLCDGTSIRWGLNVFAGEARGGRGRGAGNDFARAEATDARLVRVRLVASDLYLNCAKICGAASLGIVLIKNMNAFADFRSLGVFLRDFTTSLTFRTSV